ncbi:MAG: endonuclease/exonuclease/phosphatase family protein [Bacteroidales bacterium]|nr:endonuclease/exonuclease/phosphatase family protein [Bacteroidales bacterium]
MMIRKLFLLTLLPAVLFFQSCGPENVVNPVTPPSTGTEDPQKPEDPPASTSADAMLVCTFNIRYANTADKFPDGTSAAWSVRAPAVKKFVETNKPDLIGLQEVRKEQSQWFSSTFGSEYGYYDVCRDNASGSSVASAGGEGVGLLYKKERFELVLKDFFWLDDKPRERPAQNSDGTYGAWNSACRRVTVYAELKDKKHNNSIVWFFPTHYDHKSDAARKNAAELMITQMKALCKVTDLKNAEPVIIHVGDLNTTPENAALKPLFDNMSNSRDTAESANKYQSTFNGFGDSSKIIDFIFYGGKSVKPVKYWVDIADYGVPFISDHYPVLFQWEYQ